MKERERVLSVRQPNAGAIMNQGRGRKPIENRPWTTSIRGRLWIQAAKTIDRKAPEVVWRAAGLLGVPKAGILTGVILGYVTLDAIYEPDTYESPWSLAGQYHWHLVHPVLLAEPLPVTGALGFWWAPEGIEYLPVAA